LQEANTAPRQRLDLAQNIDLLEFSQAINRARSSSRKRAASQTLPLEYGKARQNAGHAKGLHGKMKLKKR
jgi:hypothetical protein